MGKRKKNGIDGGDSEFLITREELRQYEGLEGLSDEEADNIIQSLEDFCNLTYEFYLELMKKDYEQGT